MTCRAACIGRGLLLAVLIAPSGDALAVELAIPPGYFNRSGGFYVAGCGERACLRFTAMRGCTFGTHDSVLQISFAEAQADSATASWYAGQVPLYARGICAPFENPLGDAGPGEPTSDQWEDIGPGLPSGRP